MTQVWTIVVLTFLSAIFVRCENNLIQVHSNASCIPAFPPVNASARNASCIFYEYKGEFCKNITSSLYVYGDQSTLDTGEREAVNFKGYFDALEITPECRIPFKDLFCVYGFPNCDDSLVQPKERPICRSSCEYLQVVCKREMALIRDIPIFQRYVDLANCSSSKFSSANGGDAPECYQWYDLPGDDTESTDCFHGVGFGYRGNINVTRSGRTCQSWKSQCPHRHWRIPEDVANSKNDSNTCRNPDSSAPDGPWCYTADPNVRWEYCNVSRCPSRVPEEAPTFLKGHPLNSTAILISWKNIPPSRYEEKLLGYRIQYRSKGSELYDEANTTSNLTQDVITKLRPNTAYEIMVNGFNEIGHGRTSMVLVVKTLSSEPVLVIVTLAPNGCLLDQLKKKSENPYYNVRKEAMKFTPQDKMKIARDVVCGMLHLASKKGMLPVRWMALESLEDYTYNTKADVWSFGVLLWEIESGGKMPYSGLGGMEIIKFLKAGRILAKPDGCPDEIYDMMKSCWSLDSTKRPSFSELLESLEEEIKTKSEVPENENYLEPEFNGTTNISMDESND